MEPKCWKEIEKMNNLIKTQNWLKATKKEMELMRINKTWKFVELPIGKQVIRCKWTFKTKYNSITEIDKYKA